MLLTTTTPPPLPPPPSPTAGTVAHAGAAGSAHVDDDDTFICEIHDVVYGKIYLPPDVTVIIQTPQFQRLKQLKQLGLLKLKNGLEQKHNRYHHCIGTYHAAGLMLEALEKNTPWLSENNNRIPLLYRQAVQIAALLHDIGHGPFSHTWERIAHNYEHEKIGFACVDEIFASIDETLFPELRANNNYGIRLIKSLIQGKIKKLPSFQLELPKKYHFIFGIVSNEHYKIDVDKWDYLKRDHYYLNEICSPNMDFDDVFLKAKVSQCGEYIEYRYEDYRRIYNLLAARWHFHRDCYQLASNLISDEIFRLAIAETKANIDGVEIEDINAEHDMPAFLKMTDENVMRLIDNHPLSTLLTSDTEFHQLKDNEELQEVISQTKIDIPSVTSFIDCDIFQFYGTPQDKPVVIDETKNIRCFVQFNYDIR
ncbi:deoxynucleoside triphosphate triphosphohydrolase SAMHD1 homolog [Musca vetustissima]|uniref:deoxynucleoside triphosphate triphosphohydrolase SAMHD1 homolog n=1 Tax=Musca vetustissima TaxID=27455 RepID=UPI002AB7394F|nr:deoxynucleoside triphosphate triphosphohydrolase SAMHD1 homolog [Musca vetustissima]